MSNEHWIEDKAKRAFRKRDASVDFSNVARAGYLVFSYGDRQTKGYVELIAAGVAFWPQTVEEWSDGEKVSDRDRKKIVEDLLDLSSGTGVRIQVVS